MANLITSCRILLSLLLLSSPPCPPAFTACTWLPG